MEATPMPTGSSSGVLNTLSQHKFLILLIIVAAAFLVYMYLKRKSKKDCVKSTTHVQVPANVDVSTGVETVTEVKVKEGAPPATATTVTTATSGTNGTTATTVVSPATAQVAAQIASALASSNTVQSANGQQ